MQSNLAKQLAKLVKVKYVEDISAASRVGKQLECASHMLMHVLPPCMRLMLLGNHKLPM